MLSAVLATLAALTLSAAPLTPAPLPSTSPHAELGAFVGTPLVLGAGQLFGVDAAGWLGGAWRLGARARLGLAAEDDVVWHVTHTELHLLGLAGWAQPLGRGELGLAVGAGLLGLREVRERHQADRLVSAGLEPRQSSWSAGVVTVLEASLRLVVFDRFGLVMEAGPQLFWVSNAPTESSHLGFSAALGATYTFGGDEEGP